MTWTARAGPSPPSARRWRQWRRQPVAAAGPAGGWPAATSPGVAPRRPGGGGCACLGGAVPDQHVARAGLLLLAVLREGARLLAGALTGDRVRAVGDNSRGEGRAGGRHGQQRGADGQHLPRLAVQPVHQAGVRAGHLDHGLGRLDLDHDLVDGDLVADRDQPAHDLGLGQALAEVGQQERLGVRAVRRSCRTAHGEAQVGRVVPLEPGDRVEDPVHAGQVVRAPASAAGTGCRTRLTRSTGACSGGSSAPDPGGDLGADAAKPCASWTTTHRPVRRTEAQTVSSSNGTIERRSTTSRSQPSAAAASAASRRDRHATARRRSGWRRGPARRTTARAERRAAGRQRRPRPCDQYSFLGSRKTTGSGSAIASRSSP